MRIECTDGTAYWDWSDRKVLVGSTAVPTEVKDLKPGDTICIAGPPAEYKTVARVIGDTEYQVVGGRWIPIEDDANGHPRGGVLYQVNPEPRT